MQTDHSARAGHLASHTLKFAANSAIDQVDLAIDILRVVHLAMRANDYHGEREVEAIADVTCTTIVVLDRALDLLRGDGNEVEEGGADAS